MSYIPGLTYEQKSKLESRSCTVIRVDNNRCLVTFQLKKGVQQCAVLPAGRLFSPDGACARLQPPQAGEKLNCDLVPTDDHVENATWLAVFAWRGKMDSSSKSAATLMRAVPALVTEVAEESGVVQFVAPTGGRQRCWFGRRAVAGLSGASLPRLLATGTVVSCDCQRSSVAAGCRYVADKVWLPGSDLETDQSAAGSDLYPGRSGGGSGDTNTGYIHRVTLRAVLGRVLHVVNFKAVLGFDHGGQPCRALMLAAKFSFSEKATAQDRRDLARVLSRGDLVLFTCHEYDKPDGSDRCGWWVMEAEKLESAVPSVPRQAGFFNQGLLYEKIGHVTELSHAEGQLRFVLDKRREVGWFSVSEVFINGQLCSERLSDALAIDTRVHFNAEPAPDRPRGAGWRCTCVWRGEQPSIEAVQQRLRDSAAKKLKKAKHSRDTMNDLDDFDVPSTAAMVVDLPLDMSRLESFPELTAGGDARAARPSEPIPGKKPGADFTDSYLGTTSTREQSWTDDDWGGCGGDAAAEVTSVAPAAGSGRHTPRELVLPATAATGAATQRRRPDRPALVPLLRPSPPPPQLSPARPPPPPPPSFCDAPAAAGCLNGHAGDPSAAAAEPSVTPPVRPAPPGLPAPAASAAVQQQRDVTALQELLRRRPEVSQQTPVAPPLLPYSQHLSGPPGLVAPWIQYLPAAYGGGVPPVEQTTEQQWQQRELEASVGWEQALASDHGSHTSASTSASLSPHHFHQSDARVPMVQSAPLANELVTETVEAHKIDTLVSRERAFAEQARSVRDAREALFQEEEALVNRLQVVSVNNASEPASSPSPISGTGVILAFVDEECGLLEWERHDSVDQVMFERRNCFWLGASMDALDLADCYSAGEEVSFQCVPAPEGQPYQWVATELHQLDD